MSPFSADRYQGRKMKVLGLLITLFAAGIAVVYDLMPFHDDWCYATAPNPDFVWKQLLPDEAFWRPFDVLWGAIMAKVPWCFPLANRIAVVFAHTVSVLFVWRGLRAIAVEKYSCVTATLFFALSSSIAATLFNSDAINQSWSFLFGSFAFCKAMEMKDSSGRKWVGVAGIVLLSMLFKESGISWFVVIPAALYWRERDLKALVVRSATGCAAIVVYFLVRFCLMGDIAVGGNQYYALGFDLEKIIVNFGIAVFLPLSGFDVLAFVCEYWVLLTVSVFCSILFWGSWIASSKYDEMRLKMVLFAVSALAFAAPHCFFKGHHPAEMHFYPVLFAGAFFLALLPCAAGKIPLRIVGTVAMVVLFACGWFNKVSEVRKHSERTRRLFLELSKKNLDYSKPVYFIAEGDPEVKYYSVFTESAGHGVYWGRACRAFNGWRDFDYHLAVSPMEAASIPFGAQTVRIK